MEQTALQEGIRDIARVMIAEGTDAKIAFESISAAAAGLAKKTAEIRSQVAGEAGWLPLGDFTAQPHQPIDLLMPDGGWVRGWSSRPSVSLQGVERLFWFWPTDGAEPGGGERAITCQPTAWRFARFGEAPQNGSYVPFIGNYREQK